MCLILYGILARWASSLIIFQRVSHNLDAVPATQLLLEDQDHRSLHFTPQKTPQGPRNQSRRHILAPKSEADSVSPDPEGSLLPCHRQQPEKDFMRSALTFHSGE